MYNHKLINDLAWAIGSPSLVDQTTYTDDRLLTNEWFKKQIEDNHLILSEQDKSPQLIQSYLSQMPAFRLGLYFENLLAYWFTIHPDYQVLKKNVVISSENTTIGELDFILKELSSGKVIHLEVSVKFYLQIVHKNKAVWLGPNLNDNFELKLAKIFNRQIELSNKPITTNTLNQYGIEIDERWVIIKGRLFSHDSKLSADTCWLTIDEFEAYNDTQSQWVILPKTHWLSHVNNLDYNFLAADIHDKDSLLVELNNTFRSSPVCIAQINNQIETKRLFITPDDWEQKAKDTLG